MVTSFPHTLLHSVEEKLCPLLAFLQDAGIKDQQLAKVLTQCPRLLSSHFEGLGGMAGNGEMEVHVPEVRAPLTRGQSRADGPACVLGIGTAVPPTEFLQSDYPDFFFNVTNTGDRDALKAKFKRICDKSGIRKRHMFLTEEVLKANPGICTYMEPSLNVRHDIVVVQVPKLAAKAAVKAIKDWGGRKSEITQSFFVSCFFLKEDVWVERCFGIVGEEDGDGGWVSVTGARARATLPIVLSLFFSLSWMPRF